MELNCWNNMEKWPTANIAKLNCMNEIGQQFKCSLLICSYCMTTRWAKSEGDLTASVESQTQIHMEGWPAVIS